MNQWRKKAVIIEAEEFQPDSLILPFAAQKVCQFEAGEWFIDTPQGRMALIIGDWVIREGGEYFLCKPSIFAATYEPAYPLESAAVTGETRTPKAIRECAEWLAACRKLGWLLTDLDALEAMWWQYHNHRGELISGQKTPV